MGSVLGTTPPHDVTFSRSDILVSEDVIDRVQKQHLYTPPSQPVPPTPTYSSPDSPRLHTREPPSDIQSDVASIASQCITYSRDEVEQKYEALLRKYEGKRDASFRAAEEEYARVVDRLQAKYLKNTPEVCCADAQNRVMDCYKNNGKYSLNCSKEVDSFVRCVAAFRFARMDRSNQEAL